jgi:hypothetical protein
MKTILRITFITTVLGLTQSAHALLPPEAVEFLVPEPSGRAPLAAALSINGRRPSSAELPDYFEEKLWAHLPGTQKIQVIEKSGKESWNYPVGTEVFHEIRLRTAEGSVPFELRRVKKEKDQSWSFTSFSGSPWVRLDDSQATLPNESLQYHHPKEGAVTLNWRRIHPRNCRNCHSMRVDREEFPTLELVGPCGFTSANPTLTHSWARDFESVRGHSPFERVQTP